MAAPTIVQHKSGFLSGVSTLTVTLTSAVLAGSMIVVFIGTASGATGSGQCIVNTPTMTGETLAKIIGASNIGTSGNGQVACYATNSAVGGHTAVVVTLSGTSGVSDLHMHVIEISGQAASPQDATGNTQSTTASVSTSGATTTATDLVLAFFFDFALNHTLTAGAGYATLEQTNDVATGDVGYSESKTVAATGTQTATCTGTSTDTIEAAILAIAGAAGGSFIPEDDSFMVPRPANIETTVSVW